MFRSSFLGAGCMGEPSTWRSSGSVYRTEYFGLTVMYARCSNTHEIRPVIADTHALRESNTIPLDPQKIFPAIRWMLFMVLSVTSRQGLNFHITLQTTESSPRPPRTICRPPTRAKNVLITTLQTSTRQKMPVVSRSISLFFFGI